MEEEIIPGSPCSTQQKRKRISKGGMRKKSKSDTNTYSYDVDNNAQHFSQSQLVCQNIINDASNTTNPSSNVNSNSPKSKGPRAWSRRDILSTAFLLEEANHFPVSCSSRTIICDPPTLDFVTVTQQIATQQSSPVVKLDERCKPSSNAQYNIVMESQCDITNTQFLRVAQEVDRNLHAPSPQETNINEETVEENPFVMLESINEIHSNDIVEHAQSPTTVDQRKSIVELIVGDFSSPAESPVNATLWDEQFSPTVIRISSRVKKTYSRMAANAIRVQAEEQLQEFNIPSPSASSCSANALESDDEEVNVQHNISVGEPSALNVNDEEVDLNKSLHVIDNIQNLSNFYSQSLERPDKNDVNETFKLIMESKCHNDEAFERTKPSQSLEDQEDFIGFDNSSITSKVNFNGFTSDSDDSSFICRYSSVWCKNSSIDEISHPPVSLQIKEFLECSDDDDLFASFRTQNHKPIFKEREPVASTSASALKQTGHPPNENVLQSNATNINPTNFFGDLPAQGSVNQISTHSLSTSNLKPQFENLSCVPDQFQGFRTVRGAPIQISKKLPSRIMNLFDDIEKECDTEINEPDRLMKTNPNCNNVKFNPPHGGFSSASAIRIPGPMTSKTKTSNPFFDAIKWEDEIEKVESDRANQIYNGLPNKIDEKSSESKKSNTDSKFNPLFATFSTGEGHLIPMSKSTKNLFGDIEREYEMEVDQRNQFLNGFPNKISDIASLSKTKSTDVKFGSPYAAFSTARGNQIPDLTGTTPKSATIFDEVTMDHSISSVIELPKCTFVNKFSKDHSCKNKILKSATRSFREVTNSLEYANMEPEQTVFSESTSNILPSMLNSIDVFAKPSPLRCELLVSSLRKSEAVQSKENINGLHSSVRVNATAIKQQSLKVSDEFSTPINYSKTWTQEGRESAEVLMQDERSSFITADDLSEGFHKDLISCSSTPIQTNNNNRNRPRQVRLIERFDDIALENSADFHIQNVSIQFQVPENVIAMRKTAFENQCRIIDDKTNVSPLPGVLYMKKLISSKLTWKNFVDNNRPMNGVPHPELSKSVLTLTADNAKEYKFSAWDQYSEEFCRENISGIRLTDDINVIMDENCQIGLSQISNAFLSCPTVDPKLIHEKWIENSFRWIVIKLAAMERSFPHKFIGHALTLENVMLQFKYRYDREIDRVERSAIRKICEMDDIPAKRMILFVAAIHISDCGVYELELSDGWYSLLSTLDNQMTKIVCNGKIKIGTKLMIQGAELMGLDSGCHPLDLPRNVRLKIFANSTRRARWDTRLGYCKNAGPFLISLKSVLGDGGSISKLRICVLREYPIVYLDRSNNSCIHSQKVEKRRSMDEEQIYSNLAEKVYSQVCKDYENEEKAELACIRSSKAMNKHTNVPEITDPAILYELLEHGNDPESIEHKMTESQKVMVTNYKNHLIVLRNDKISSRVQKKLAAIKDKTRKSTPLLKFKISDENSFDKTATVSIWNPSEELSNIIHEEAVLEMTSSSARGIKSDELQIYAGKACVFKKLNGNCQLPEAYRRRPFSILEIYSIVQPMFNELDTTGIVILIGDATTKLQPVYIADHEYNILCINFWGGLKAKAYDDVVQPERILAAKNLQWRTISSNTSIRSAFVTEVSIFTTNPKSLEHEDAVTSLKKKFETIDMAEYIKTCTKKIFEIKALKSSTPVRTTSMGSMQSPALSLPRTPTDLLFTSHRSALSNKSRIDALSRSYGEPLLASPPLHIKSINRDFKPPSSSK